jgi:FkbM family methyltransferase
MVSSLLSQIGIHSFDPILRARFEALGPLRISIDGGAGWGDTAKKIAETTAEGGLIYAFEPFPGNHKFFDEADPRIKLIKSAIGDSAITSNFLVTQVVGSDDPWAEKGLAGYSSVGHLPDHPPLWKLLARKIRGAFQENDRPACVSLQVNVTRIDQTVQENHIDFVKLDLQGAEYQALIGMGQLLDETDMLWIEFSNQPRLYDYLVGNGFLIFDTNYLCTGSSANQLEKLGLRAIRRIMLSTSQPAVIATRISDSDNYLDWFNRAKKMGVLQTDLLAVNPKFLPNFLTILGKIGASYTQDPAYFQEALL